VIKVIKSIQGLNEYSWYKSLNLSSADINRYWEIKKNNNADTLYLYSMIGSAMAAIAGSLRDFLLSLLYCLAIGWVATMQLIIYFLPLLIVSAIVMYCVWGLKAFDVVATIFLALFERAFVSVHNAFVYCCKRSGAFNEDGEVNPNLCRSKVEVDEAK
jgi:hypothetical protein